MIVTRAAALHAPVLAALHATSFETPWNEAEFQAVLSLPGALCLLGGDEPCGFVLARTAADEAEILTIAVSPEHRRKHFGHAMLREAIEILRRENVRSLFLEVAADNIAALSLYRACGFAPCGERRGYYGDGAKNALVMKLDLALKG